VGARQRIAAVRAVLWTRKAGLAVRGCLPKCAAMTDAARASRCQRSHLPGEHGASGVVGDWLAGVSRPTPATAAARSALRSMLLSGTVLTRRDGEAPGEAS
jgi:hypothetical protein